ncbi:predicted protein [Lichtheimia corymbifera JMRC:FSU:9682]|uniref:Uncharacterized protein n=1 Tax=Lichtheimia corymbifera JMRC:FSU:9682 TaxID=1263082 RepID=A0A068RW69_9FUNG|nr:predicted protein [Lichtheimia corymbifera JMRC:FSU:9682]
MVVKRKTTHTGPFAIREDHSFYLNVSIVYHEDEDDGAVGDINLKTAVPRLETTLPPPLLFILHSRHSDQGGCCQGDIVVLVLRVDMPLHAWCQKAADSSAKTWARLAFVSARLHYAMVSYFQ